MTLPMDQGYHSLVRDACQILRDEWAAFIATYNASVVDIQLPDLPAESIYQGEMEKIPSQVLAWIWVEADLTDEPSVAYVGANRQVYDLRIGCGHRLQQIVASDRTDPNNPVLDPHRTNAHAGQRIAGAMGQAACNILLPQLRENAPGVLNVRNRNSNRKRSRRFADGTYLVIRTMRITMNAYQGC